ncbi:MAG: YjjG family noncanonical pyrimidine nucleotidase [Acidimicrobiia bacterium]|nr:YjjG family noncanonical pyrimidine nucleotidase [Acidimicrobiia bacterium]
MTYSTLLFDLDFTLFDSDVSEDQAFRYALADVDVPWSTQIVEVYAEINGGLWKAVERGELTPLDVRTTRFEMLFDQLSIDADPVAAADAYVYGMGAFGDLYPDARGMLEDVGTGRAMGLVTNGIGEVQRARIDRLDLERHFAAIVISGEEGVAKPGAEIFDRTFARLGHPERTSVLMIGDSLSSDMAGGIAYGIDTCWFNRDGRAPASDLPISHTVTALNQIPAVLTDPRR